MLENVINTVWISIAVICLLALMYITLDLIKNEFTYRNQIIIVHAIHDYNMYLIENGQFDINNPSVTYADMEDYDTTQKRFWDWGYTRILPPEKFELIKPFIKE
jgi:hypothetical protein